MFAHFAVLKILFDRTHHTFVIAFEYDFSPEILLSFECVHVF